MGLGTDGHDRIRLGPCLAALPSRLLQALVMEPLLQFFAYDHLRPDLQEVSRPFAELANHVVTLPRNPERTVALRKLLEAKDCAVRAALWKDVPLTVHTQLMSKDS
jgi:hypothetical protein